MSSVRWLLILFVSAAAAGCGGDRSGIVDPVSDPTPNFVRLQSDAGDYIGGGLSYNYTQADAVITVAATGNQLAVTIRGDESWFGIFQEPSPLSQLQPGNYVDLQRYPFHDPTRGGLSWDGEGRGCNTLLGWFTIDSVTYVGGALASVDLRFEQHCDGSTSALRGTMHWRSDDDTAPPGPVDPVPAELWRPASGATPSGGDFVYLQSDVGDYIGAGQTYTYTQADASIALAVDGGRLSVTVNGAQWWIGEFQAMNTLPQLRPGYYGDLRRYPFHNPVKGGLTWFGEGRGCNTLLGWFAVDRVTLTDGIVTAIDLRFEQRCDGGTAALHGAIHRGG